MFNRFSPRRWFFALSVLCSGMLGFGFYLQNVKGIEPCPLCILQRYAFVGIAVIAFIAAVHNAKGLMRSIYGGIIALIALAGGGVAARQIYLQLNPPTEISCGPDLAYMVNTFPLSDLLPKLFRGDGDCAQIDWTFLGFSIAQWALLWFSIIAIIGIWQMLRRWANPKA